MSVAAPKLEQVLTHKIDQITGRRVRGLSVEVNDGLVILRGRANSFHVKQLAQHGVRMILPNARLRNGIVVS